MLNAVRASLGEARSRRRVSTMIRRQGGHVRGRPVFAATDLHVGDGVVVWSLEAVTLLTGGGRLQLGDRVFINSGALVSANNSVTIGDDVAVGLQAVVVDSHMHGVAGRPVRYERTTIGDGTWLGMRAMVLAGVTVGRRCIVGAGAVVTRDVEDDTLVAGNPARPVRRLEYPSGCVKAWNDDWDPSAWSDGGRA